MHMKFRRASRGLSLFVLSLLFISSCSEGDKLLGGSNTILKSEYDASQAEEKMPSVKVLSIRTIGKATGDAYAVGDTITFEVELDESVDIITTNGVPQLKLNIGGVTKLVDYVLGSGSGGKTLTFTYKVASDDFDADGIEVMSIDLNSGAAQGESGSGVNLELAKPIVIPLAKVDAKGPVIQSVSSGDKTYVKDNVIIFTVAFDETVDVDTSSGKPLLKVTIGNVTKDATYDSVAGSKSLVFKYEVGAGDFDADGIKATSISLNSGKIKDKAGNDAELTTANGQTPAKVDTKGPVIQSVSSGDKTYVKDNVIIFTVAFDETVDVDTSSGKPLLKVTIGNVTKDATYDSVAGSKSLVFKYEVGAGDFDADGIEATSISLNSGKIKDKAGNDAELTTANGQTPAKVDTKKPVIQSVSSANQIYGKGKVIPLTVTFDETVDVDTSLGKPLLKVTIGNVTKDATYDSVAGSKSLVFKYEVEAGDFDADGIKATSISLNLGTIKDELGNDAELTTANGQTPAKVDAKKPVIQSVSSVAKTYGKGELITFTVAFDETVDVTGTPKLTFDVGGVGKSVDYVLGSGSKALVFEYTVALGDFDANPIKATSISLNSGKIKDKAGNDANLTLTTANGQTPAKVDARAKVIKVSSTTPAGIYAPGEEVKILVEFSDPIVVVKGSGITIELDVGGTPLLAYYTVTDPSNTLVFIASALPGTVDDLDGIEVVANSIKRGNGASIKSGVSGVIEDFARKKLAHVKIRAPFEFSGTTDIWFDSTDADADGDAMDQKAGDRVAKLYDRSGKDNHISALTNGIGPEVRGTSPLNNGNLSLFFGDYSARTADRKYALLTRKDPKLDSSGYTYFVSFTRPDNRDFPSGYSSVFATRNGSNGVAAHIHTHLLTMFKISFLSKSDGSVGPVIDSPGNLSGKTVHSLFVSDLVAPGARRVYSQSGQSDTFLDQLSPYSKLVPGTVVSMGVQASNLGNLFIGYVNEALYFSRELGLAEKSIVEHYLASKWNSPGVVGRDYYKGDESSKGDYDHGVTGILKLPITTISSHDLPASSVSVARAGALLIANSASDGFLKDEGDSVFAGSKGNGATKDNLLNSSASTVRSGKVWYLNVSDDSTNSGGKIDLAFTPSLMGFDWTADAASYELLWSASDPSASPPSVTFQVMTAPTSAANGIVRFNGIDAKSGYIALGLKDTVAPSLRYAEVTGDKEITLTFDESLASPPSGFSVSGGGVNVSNTNIDTRSDNKVVLTTDNTLQPASTVSYSGTGVSDIAGNALTSLPNVVVGTSVAGTFTTPSNGGTVVAGAGDDKIMASSGSDVFDYNFITDGNDTISGFDKSVDKIDLSDLLQYSNGQDISKFVAVSDDGTKTTINVDAHGRGNTSALAGTGERDISITLSGVTGLITLDSLIKDKVLILTAP